VDSSEPAFELGQNFLGRSDTGLLGPLSGTNLAETGLLGQPFLGQNFRKTKAAYSEKKKM
jgi:hypothetical protein